MSHVQHLALYLLNPPAACVYYLNWRAYYYSQVNGEISTGFQTWLFSPRPFLLVILPSPTNTKSPTYSPHLPLQALIWRQKLHISLFEWVQGYSWKEVAHPCPASYSLHIRGVWVWEFCWFVNIHEIRRACASFWTFKSNLVDDTIRSGEKSEDVGVGVMFVIVEPWGCSSSRGLLRPLGKRTFNSLTRGSSPRDDGKYLRYKILCGFQWILPVHQYIYDDQHRTAHSKRLADSSKSVINLLFAFVHLFLVRFHNNTFKITPARRVKFAGVLPDTRISLAESRASENVIASRNNINTILRGCGRGHRSGNIIADFTYDDGMRIILVFNFDAAVERSVVSSSQASKILDFGSQAEGVRVELIIWTVVG